MFPMKFNKQSIKAGSFRRIYEGFQQISKTDQIEYLKYLDLVIERKENLVEKNKLRRFKKRLNEICLQKVKSVSKASL